jgi:hypothetical protein
MGPRDLGNMQLSHIFSAHLFDKPPFVGVWNRKGGQVGWGPLGC